MADDKPPRPIRIVIDNARPAPRDAPPAPPPDAGSGGPALPRDCPVEPLGVLDDTAYYLDATRQLRALPAREHSRLGIQFLFGRRNYLLPEFWPRFDKEGDKVPHAWRPELAAEALMAAAHGKGVWNPFQRVRGRGAWRDPDGGLVLHCGDAVLTESGWQEPGHIGRHVYPAGDAILQPAVRAVTASPAEDLLALFGTWNWRRKVLDPLLLLGWVGAAILGGALDWRPLAWITGGSETGKSTLHKLIGALMGSSLLQVSEASAAGVWQKLGHSTLPVTFDELESEEDNRRAQAVIKLARQAASGGLVLRGGADHSAAEFTARSCFLFSSILVPPLLGQDRNRMAILELGALGEGDAPRIDEGQLSDIGAQLLRRLVDGWARYPQALGAYRAALLREVRSGRFADVFGTLLAVADILLKDGEVDHDTAELQAMELSHAALSEAGDTMRDEELCLQHLTTTALPLGGGRDRHAVAQLLERAADNEYAAQQQLHAYGLKVHREDGRNWFAVASNHVELAHIFDGTHWAGRSGAMGVWVQALRRLPGVERSRGTVRFGGATGKATLLPIELVISVGGKDERSHESSNLFET